MAKKYMAYIRKAGGRNARKLLAVILAAGMAMTALPGEAITALAQETTEGRNVAIAADISGSDDRDISGSDIAYRDESDISGNTDLPHQEILGEIPVFPGYVPVPGEDEADTVVYDASALSVYSALDQQSQN